MNFTDQELKQAALKAIDETLTAPTLEEAERHDLRFQAIWRILDRRQAKNQTQKGE